MEAPADCGIPTEAELQRACGTLYITHGLESTCGLVLFLFFATVAVKLHARSHLNSPALAFIRYILCHTYEFIDEYITTLYTVAQMNEMKLEQRLRFCSNVDKMVNACSAALSLLGITRWLSIGNVNGMRYIGYAITCPMMQVELVVLLAPFVPCYQLCAVTSFLATFTTLASGYAASLLEMKVWEGDMLKFLSTFNPDDLGPTQKLWVVAPSFGGIAVLFFIILPYLVMIYTCSGGNSHPDLPPEYRYLVCIVWITWVGFPAWWLLSWEGNGIITDTKFNEIGFTVLNMCAKGLFTLQGFRMGELAEARIKSQRGAGRQGSDLTEGDLVPPIISRASSRKLSRSKFVSVLRKYDDDEWDSDSEVESDSERVDGSHSAAGGRQRGGMWVQQQDRSCGRY